MRISFSDFFFLTNCRIQKKHWIYLALFETLRTEDAVSSPVSVRPILRSLLLESRGHNVTARSPAMGVCCFSEVALLPMNCLLPHRCASCLSPHDFPPSSQNALVLYS